MHIYVLCKFILQNIDCNVSDVHICTCYSEAFSVKTNIDKVCSSHNEWMAGNAQDMSLIKISMIKLSCTTTTFWLCIAHVRMFVPKI